MPSASHSWFRSLTAATSLSLLAIASACDPGGDPADKALEVVDATPVSPRLEIEAQAWSDESLAEAVAESAEILAAEAGPEAAQAGCSFDTFQMRIADDILAITGPPGAFFAPLPAGITIFDEPVLADSYYFSMKVRDVNGDVVGFASEQEIVDFVNNESKTSWTVTVPGRGTLMLTEIESFQVLIDEIDDMVANQEFVRTYNPPLIEALTIPGTGKVTGGSDEFENAHGIWQELGVIHEIDLINNEFDLGAILQVLSCG